PSGEKPPVDDPDCECKDENNDHNCDICGEPVSVCADNNNDHDCDICGAELSQCADNNNDHDCDVCGAELSQCADNNNDHDCDVCGAELSQCADNNNDHDCDVCGAELSQCADNNNDHDCDVCGAELSQCADNNNDHDCDVCGAELSQCADNDNDHDCDICGETLSGHSYGDWIKVDDETHKKVCACDDTVTEPHTWNDGEVTTEPTYSSTGEKTYTCTATGCGATKTEVVEKLTRPTSSSLGGGVVTYTVRFETDGAETIESQRVKSGEVIEKPEDPTKEGYEFAGWYTDEALKNEYDFSSKVTKSFVLYAKWIEEKSEDQEGTDKFFMDVDVNDWYYDAVEYVYDNGIMKGISDNEFAPDDTLTRAQLVTVIYRIEGEPPVDRSIPFSDVDLPSYYKNAVIWAKENDIVKGVSDTEFAPFLNITREQMVAVIYRYAQFKGYDLSVVENTSLDAFNDADKVSAYAVPAMKYAVGSGMVRGKSNSMLDPKGSTTRAEFAQIMYNFFKN
ncbi:MAG: S-layer homology domain-containing protein, partial [Clostridia bacterium]|nr:S-layer homology domain-containing protein [Clostridia bacterium]